MSDLNELKSSLAAKLVGADATGSEQAFVQALSSAPAGTEGALIVRNIPSGTQAVSGIVSVGNFPATQPVSGAVSVSNFPATQAISGSVSVSNFPSTFAVSNFPATQAVTVGNFPATQAVSGSVFVSNFPASFSVSNFPTIQTVAGSVSVSNFPTIQTVTVSNLPATQVVSGTVAVSNFPASFGRTWTLASTTDTVAAVQSGTWTVSRNWTLGAATDSVDVRNITGTVPLPTGASTSALQTSTNASLTSIDSKLNSLGQKTSAGSVPVVVASDSELNVGIKNGLITHVDLLNGASPSMAVSGTLAAPINFDYLVPAGVTLYLHRLKLLFMDAGTSLATNFGGITGLTNGVQLILKINGTVYTIDTIKNNAELALVFSDNKFIPPTSGFFESSDGLLGDFIFPHPIRLTNSTGDFVRMSIRDNLTAIDILRVKALLVRNY